VPGTGISKLPLMKQKQTPPPPKWHLISFDGEGLSILGYDSTDARKGRSLFYFGVTLGGFPIEIDILWIHIL